MRIVATLALLVVLRLPGTAAAAGLVVRTAAAALCIEVAVERTAAAALAPVRTAWPLVPRHLLHSVLHSPQRPLELSLHCLLYHELVHRILEERRIATSRALCLLSLVLVLGNIGPLPCTMLLHLSP